ncbi:hypothetical protein [Rugosimonospora africana]|uniref:DUF3558 domain-containing protein n=1 Tax=Rugosimonospora africana TaxID=556532 RepID=A0A8J3QUA2_9ACTN|nr:hypothetical protein [Rugosimonospora africana]GIH16664.1 hypothetical protein Raf01_48360 [Rugosimonospora africana]
MTSKLGRLVVLVALTVTVAGCGPDRHVAAPGAAVSAGASAAGVSATGRLICSDEAQEDIATAVGLPTSRPVAGTLRGNEYSCDYTYPAGTMALSVTEFADDAGTDAFFGSVRTSWAGSAQLAGIGQDAYQSQDGSMVVRKDRKVLRVDVGGLPARFGQPPTTRRQLAAAVAVVIMDCWTES